MRYRTLALVFGFVTLIELWLAPSLVAFRQQATSAPAVVLSRIEIRYPSIAESAIVSGTVSVRVGVRPDGTVAETTVVEGNDLPLLNNAAKTAAAGAIFECGGCNEPSTPHLIVFVFSLGDDRLPTTWKQTSDASSEVTVIGKVPIFYGEAPT